MIENYINLVNNQISYYRKMLERFPPENPRYRPAQAAMYQRLINDHRELLKFLLSYVPGQVDGSETVVVSEIGSEQPAKLTPIAPVKGPEDDLPPELLKQLTGKASKAETDPLVQIINEHGGMATLDEILIGLYRKTGEIGKRALINNRIYRLSKQGAIWIVPNKKGVYSTTPITS